MKLILLIILLSLTGCASIDNAGYSGYSITAVKDAKGAVSGYELQVKDGKEYAGRSISFQAQGSSVGVTIQEGQSKAFKGQAIGAKALTILPVDGLADLLK